MTEPSTPKLTQVAVGIVYNAAGQVLFAQRPAGKPYAGWWEFPGGKIEADETVAMALARELREELGIQILDCQPWLTQRYIYPHAHVNLQFCNVRSFSGQVQSLEAQAFVWGAAQNPPLPFLPAALPVLKAMQLPAVLRFTAVANEGDAWQARLMALVQGTIIVHQPQLSQTSAHAVFKTCLAWKALKPCQRRVLVASCHPQAWWGLADGVHLLTSDLRLLKQRPSCAWVGAATQDSADVQTASALGCHYVTVSAAAGWGVLGEQLAQCEMASYAVSAPSLGEQHLPLAQAAGAVGVAIAL